MPISDQGFDQKRYSVIPRTLIFITSGDRVLLLLGAADKKLWANKYNGIGGHVEGGENIHESAKRELYEETSIEMAALEYCGNVLVDSGGDKGISIFIFKADYEGGQVVESAEGKLEWVNVNDLDTLPLVEDLPVILPRVLRKKKDDAPFFARSYYANDGSLRVDFD